MADQDSFTQFHSLVCKTIIHPVRQRILEAIGEKTMTVSDLQAKLEIPMSNLSNHLQALFAAGVVERIKQGSYIHYSLTDPGLLVSLKEMKRVIAVIAARKGRQLIEGSEGDLK